jgi:exonuclease III
LTGGANFSQFKTFKIMAKVFKPTKPKAKDSLDKHIKYANDMMAWNEALAGQAKKKEVKKLISAGDFAAAQKLMDGKNSAQKPKAKRQSITV